MTKKKKINQNAPIKCIASTFDLENPLAYKVKIELEINILDITDHEYDFNIDSDEEEEEVDFSNFFLENLEIASKPIVEKKEEEYDFTRLILSTDPKCKLI